MCLLYFILFIFLSSFGKCEDADVKSESTTEISIEPKKITTKEKCHDQKHNEDDDDDGHNHVHTHGGSGGHQNYYPAVNNYASHYQHPQPIPTQTESNIHTGYYDEDKYRVRNPNDGYIPNYGWDKNTNTQSQNPNNWDKNNYDGRNGWDNSGNGQNAGNGQYGWDKTGNGQNTGNGQYGWDKTANGQNTGNGQYGWDKTGNGQNTGNGQYGWDKTGTGQIGWDKNGRGQNQNGWDRNNYDGRQGWNQNFEGNSRGRNGANRAVSDPESGPAPEQRMFTGPEMRNVADHS